MKAVRLHGYKDLRLEDVGDPGAPGPGEVLLAPLWCGICGSDLKGYLGNGIGAEGPLRVMGHELSGSIVAAGPGVDSRRVGERVAVMPVEHCGTCVDCLHGDYQLCARRSFLGLYGERGLGGGMADLVAIKAYQALPLDGLSEEQGALVEPAAVALHAVIEAGAGPGHTVLVVGAGMIGTLVVLAAQAAGAAVVIVSEVNPSRAARAAQFGGVVLEQGSQADLVQQVRTITGTRHPVDVAFDCAGKSGTLELCLAAIRTGGKVSLVAGRKGSPPVEIGPLQQLPATMIGSLAYSASSWDRTVALIRAGRFPVERTVTSRIDRDRIVDDGFEALLDPGRSELKILTRIGAREA